MLRGERWLVTGSTGLVGPIVLAGAVRAGVEVVRSSLRGGDATIACDLRSARATIAMLDAWSPDRVIHLAGVSKPTLAAEHPALAYEVNVHATELIAEWCSTRDKGLLFASTDQVFSGLAGPYLEEDQVAPATVYGRTKLDAERLVLAAGGLVTRLGWVLNDRPFARHDFVERAVMQLACGQTVLAANDEQRTPIYGRDLEIAFVRLLELDRRGVVHAAGATHTTPYDLIVERARECGLDRSAIRPISRLALAPAGRPGDVRLDTAVLRSLLRCSPEAVNA